MDVVPPRFISIVRCHGGSLGVVIPHNICMVTKIKEGQCLEVTIKKYTKSESKEYPIIKEELV